MHKKTKDINAIFARSLERLGQASADPRTPAAKLPVQEMPVSAVQPESALDLTSPDTEIVEYCGSLRNLVKRLALGERTVADRAMSILNKIESAAGRQAAIA